MKYLSIAALSGAYQRLSPFNVFYGTTFLACKEAGLPIGKQIDISIDNLNKDFLVRHYKIHSRSQCYFRVLRFNERHKDWLSPGYSGKGLQSVNTRTFGQAFIHEKGSNMWGWSSDYVNFLAETLYKKKKLPAYALACSIFKDMAWADHTTLEDVFTRFRDHFRLTNQELNLLFDCSVPEELSDFQDTPYNSHDFLRPFSPPPDLEPDSGGILSFLEVNGSGCIDNFKLSLGERLNIITGDNGLGKTFILDVAWWALTGEGVGVPAYPSSSVSPQNSSIKFQISGDSPGEAVEVKYSPKTQEWKIPRQRPTLSGLLYTRAWMAHFLFGTRKEQFAETVR